MKGNVINLNTLHLNSVRLNGIGKVQSVSLKGGSTEDPVFPPIEPPIEPEPTPTYTLSASVTNGMVSAKRNGSAVNLPFTANKGDVIVVEVTPNDGYAFEGWADGNTDNPRSITMQSDVTLSAECVAVVVKDYIQFADAEVERVLIANGVSSDGVGITMEDAAKVTNIASWFNGNTAIESFDELDYFTGVTSISSNAFNGCANLQKLIFRYAIPPTLGASAFANTSFPIYVPDASLEAYKTAVNWNTYADRIHPLSEIEGSPYIQFEDAEVERVLMSKGVSSDGVGITKEDAAAVTSLNAMFNGNSAITSFDELRYFTGLTTMSNDIPAPYVGEFYNCTNLQRVTIPANVSKVLNYTFYKCTSLQSVTFEDASRITELGRHAFSNTAIGGDIAFPNLEKATSPFHSTGIERVLDLGKITSIDGISSGYASSFFDNSASLRMLYLPASLTALNGFAIGKCSALATIVSLATTPPTLSSSAFNGCGAITGIYVPDASVDAYKTSWSAHAGKIKPLSELNA